MFSYEFFLVVKKDLLSIIVYYENKILWAMLTAYFYIVFCISCHKSIFISDKVIVFNIGNTTFNK